jgi:hypothetical protein
MTESNIWLPSEEKDDDWKRLSDTLG